MSTNLPWKNHDDEPTVEEALSHEDLKRAARSGDQDALNEFQLRELARRKRLPGRYDVFTQRAANGTVEKVLVLRSYHGRRKFFRRHALWAGLTVAVVLELLILAAAWNAIREPLSGVAALSGLLANLSIIAGTFFTARGAFLGVKRGQWLQELANQHRFALNKQVNPRQSEVTRQLMNMLGDIKDEMADGKSVADAIDVAQKRLSQKLDESTSGFSKLQVLTNLDIAELFLDSSAGAVLGATLIVGGTLIIAILALYGH